MTATCKFCGQIIQSSSVILPAGGNGPLAAALATDQARLGAAIARHLQDHHKAQMQFIQHMQAAIGGLLVNLTVTSSEEVFRAELEKMRQRMIELLQMGAVPAPPEPPAAAPPPS